jgi:hypothetical protein
MTMDETRRVALNAAMELAKLNGWNPDPDGLVAMAKAIEAYLKGEEKAEDGQAPPAQLEAA